MPSSSRNRTALIAVAIGFFSVVGWWAIHPKPPTQSAQARTTAPVRPAQILAKAGAAPTPPAGEYASAWDTALAQAAHDAAPEMAAATQSVTAEQKQRQLQFISTSPIFQKHLDGSSFDALVKSINEVTAELPVEVAKGFQKGARLLMVANLPIEQLQGAHRNITDDEIHATVLKALGNKTPWEVLLAAQAKEKELEAQVNGPGAQQAAR